MAHKSVYHTMHKYTGPDLRALLVERDHQVAHLRQQLNAHIERNSLLDTRLLSTLDALDDVRASSTEEIHRLERENTRLHRACDVYARSARESEREKANLQEAVLQLVAKVESCNDYSKWQSSRLQLSRSVSISSQTNAIAGPSTQPPGFSECTCPNAYAPVIIEELSSLLDRERFAHTATIDAAERRIAVSESKIALREAELSWLHAKCHCHASSGLADGRYLPHGIRDSERKKTTSLTLERNRRLRAEVRTLTAELQLELDLQNEALRASRPMFISTSVQTEPICSVSPEALAVSSNPPQDSPTHSIFRRDLAVGGNDHIRPASSVLAPGLQALTEQIANLRKRLDDVQAERDNLRSTIETEFPEQLRKDPGRSVLLQDEESAIKISQEESNEERTSFGQNALSTLAQPTEDRDLFIFSPPNHDTLNSTFPPLVPTLSSDTTTTPFISTSLSDSFRPNPTEPSIPISADSMPTFPQSPLNSTLSSLPETPRTPLLGAPTLFGYSFDFASPSHPADELASPIVPFAQMQLGQGAVSGSPSPSPARSRPHSRIQRRSASPRPGVFSAPPLHTDHGDAYHQPNLNQENSSTMATPRLDAIARVLAEELEAEE